MHSITYEGTTYQTYGELPSVGSRAPDVSLVNTDLQDVSLANFTGMRKVLQHFPKHRHAGLCKVSHRLSTNSHRIMMTLPC